MNKRNQILSVVLAVQLVLGVIIFFPRSSSQAKHGGPLLANFSPNDVVELTIKDSADHQVVLDKGSDGKWVVPSAGNYPLQAGRAETLLQKIKDLQTDRLIATSQSSQKRLKVDSKDFEKLIVIERADGKEDRLYIGSSAGANATHMRLNDDSNVYLTSGLASWEAGTLVSSWLDLTYFSVPQDNVVGVKLENPNGTFEFTKTDGAWTLAGLGPDEQLNPDSVTGLLARVAQVRMTQPIGTTQEDSFGMDAPQATITLTVQEQKVTQPAETGASGQAGVVQLSTPVGTEAASPTPPPTPTVETVETMYTLRIGAKLDGGDYAFIASNSTYYVQVSASTAEGILNLNHDSFLVGQATPTPTAETGAAPAPETTATPASPVPEITATLALEAMPTPVPEASATLSSGS
ncbi:MAG TPA: DUF4340 domain-containing protein [Aggregatilineaceae bacterium]|nr:DUF4340 domain-containing protein [Aggregatilineaceae bacterium]